MKNRTNVCEWVDDVGECDDVEPAAGQLEGPHGVVDPPEHDIDCVETCWKKNHSFGKVGICFNTQNSLFYLSCQIFF